MSIEETKKHIEIMQAYVDGKEIEVRLPLTERWETTLNPTWDLPCILYRIKETVIILPIVKTGETQYSLITATGAKIGVIETPGWTNFLGYGYLSSPGILFSNWYRNLTIGTEIASSAHFKKV